MLQPGQPQRHPSESVVNLMRLGGVRRDSLEGAEGELDRGGEVILTRTCIFYV